jgi:hypothetical protein
MKEFTILFCVLSDTTPETPEKSHLTLTPIFIRHAANYQITIGVIDHD